MLKRPDLNRAFETLCGERSEIKTFGKQPARANAPRTGGEDVRCCTLVRGPFPCSGRCLRVWPWGRGKREKCHYACSSLNQAWLDIMDLKLRLNHKTTIFKSTFGLSQTKVNLDLFNHLNHIFNLGSSSGRSSRRAKDGGPTKSWKVHAPPQAECQSSRRRERERERKTVRAYCTITSNINTNYDKSFRALCYIICTVVQYMYCTVRVDSLTHRKWK